jgi:rubrerythrin
MGARLLPLSLPELYAHSLAMERAAMERFDELARYLRDTGTDHLADEFESIAKEEREQYELLEAGTDARTLPQLRSWEYAWQYTGRHDPALSSRLPQSARDAIGLALDVSRRAEIFYTDVAENAADAAVSAFAALMANDELRHVERLERLLEREPRPHGEPEDYYYSVARQPLAS